MTLKRLRFGAFAAAGIISLAGCMNRKDVSELHYVGPAGDDYYKGVATSIEYPNTEAEHPDEISASIEPHTINDRKKDKVWDLTLAQAIQLALANNKVIRVAGQFDSPSPNALLTNPNTAPSVYDSALQESGVLLGARGVEAALSDFDATLTSTFNYGQSQTIQNNAALAGGLPAGQVLNQYTGTLNTSLSKTFANGGTFTLSDVVNYLDTNQPVLFPSSYTGFVRAQYSQPLWAGSGVEFTRIATPLGNQLSGVSGVSQGVAIARINEDLALADFEIASLGLLRDTENAYWNLYLSYRLFHTAVVAHNSALRSWREAKAKLDIGGVAGFSPVDEPQARDQLYSTRATAETDLSQLYTNETALRRLLGLPVNDGRIIRPADAPLSGKYVPDWYNSLTEALTRRVELRKQKWAIKSLELQLKAARSLTNPTLNLTGGYQINAFGNDLLGSQSQLTQSGSSAFASLVESGQTAWNVGLIMSVPIGFRAAHAQVRNYEIRVAKARVGLAEQEMEVAHELAAAFQNVAVQYQTAQSNFNRRVAAERAVQLYESQYQVGTTTLAFVLQAQSSLASAEQNYYTSLASYAQAILDLNYRKGTLLDYHNVTLAESEWTPDAYRDAVRRAWARAHAFKADFLCTEPEEQQLPHGNVISEGVAPPAAPNGSAPGHSGTVVPPAPSTEASPQLELPHQAPPSAPPAESASASPVERTTGNSEQSSTKRAPQTKMAEDDRAEDRPGPVSPASLEQAALLPEPANAKAADFPALAP